MWFRSKKKKNRVGIMSKCTKEISSTGKESKAPEQLCKTCSVDSPIYTSSRLNRAVYLECAQCVETILTHHVTETDLSAAIIDALFLACELDRDAICEQLLLLGGVRLFDDGVGDIEVGGGKMPSVGEVEGGEGSMLCERSAKDIEGYSLLHMAVHAASWRCVQVLVQHGADVRTRTHNGATLLHTLAFPQDSPHDHPDHHIKHLIRFIKLGADINAKASFPGFVNGLRISALELALLVSNANAALLLFEAQRQLCCLQPIHPTVAMSVKGYMCCVLDYIQNIAQNNAVPTLFSCARKTVRHSISPVNLRHLDTNMLSLPTLLLDQITLSNLEEDYVSQLLMNNRITAC